MKRIRKIGFYAFFMLLLILGYHFFPSFAQIKGDSMVPNLTNGQIALNWKNTAINRFDIITFNDPKESGDRYVKRVIGLPGDQVVYKGDKLYINQKRMDEPFLTEFKTALADGRPFTHDFIVNQVPSESYFVLGDNRRISKDSRSFGFVQKKNVTGQIGFLIWPFEKVNTSDTQKQEH